MATSSSPEARICVSNCLESSLEAWAFELSLGEKHGAVVWFYLKAKAKSINLTLRGDKGIQLVRAARLILSLRPLDRFSFQLTADWRFPEEDEELYSAFQELDLPDDLKLEKPIGREFDQKVLLAILRHFKISRENLAARLGIQVNTLAKMLTSKKPLRRPYIQALVDQLPLSVDFQAAIWGVVRDRESAYRRESERCSLERARYRRSREGR